MCAHAHTHKLAGRAPRPPTCVWQEQKGAPADPTGWSAALHPCSVSAPPRLAGAGQQAARCPRGRAPGGGVGAGACGGRGGGRSFRATPEVAPDSQENGLQQPQLPGTSSRGWPRGCCAQDNGARLRFTATAHASSWPGLRPVGSHCCVRLRPTREGISRPSREGISRPSRGVRFLQVS